MQWLDPWYATYMKCIAHDMHPIWYVSYMICILYGMYPIWYASYMKCTLYDMHPIWYEKFRNYSTLGGGGTPISLAHFAMNNGFSLFRLSFLFSIPWAATLSRRSINSIHTFGMYVLKSCKYWVRSKILNWYFSKG